MPLFLDNKAFTVPAKVQQEKDHYSKENNSVLAFIEDSEKENIINQATADVYKQYQFFVMIMDSDKKQKSIFSKEVNKVLVQKQLIVILEKVKNERQ